MVMAIEEKPDLNNVAQFEWEELLKESSKRCHERAKELKEKGISSSLDGENHYKDIEEWFENSYKAIQKKYGII